MEESINNVSSDSVYETWYAVVLSFTIWVLLYFTVINLIPQKSPEFCNRLITLAHGGLMGFYGLDQCFHGESFFDNPNEPTTNNQAFILVASLGYFLLDLCWCLYYQTETALMISHHIYSCFALGRMLFKGTGGHAAACGLGALEITNPLLQARWFTRTLGYHNTSLFSSIEITFMISFFIIRIILGSLYVIFVNIQPKTSWEFRFLTILIYIMSWMFMVNILKYLSRKYIHANIEADLAHINSS